uniref:Uncharacterized protein n=1 Tax=Cacopsylla melanoneura TaxID=428564 RepID=A0A8D8VNT2_9HEMI
MLEEAPIYIEEVDVSNCLVECCEDWVLWGDIFSDGFVREELIFSEVLDVSCEEFFSEVFSGGGVFFWTTMRGERISVNVARVEGARMKSNGDTLTMISVM